MDKLRFPGLHNIYLTITTTVFIYFIFLATYFLINMIDPTRISKK